ncbi:hypothetical protein [Alicyclobacillus acidiphilus]|uniref:hypothetical protein n=1 Tax=Alicyclobacillus acidiphilus TaxID=182455 RepID=UPI00083582EC|nr:hypothetical protein [Alicyclobacillus acidiphilus]
MRGPMSYIGVFLLVLLGCVVLGVILSFLLKLALLAFILVGVYYLYARARYHFANRHGASRRERRYNR